jgi:chromosome segregation ATPase
VLGIQRIVERQRTADRINQLRDELYRARVASDRCRGSLQTSEASLRALRVTIDSLRGRVDEFEAMDRRGVPAERYDEYIEIFDQYNDSVGVWDGRESRLRQADASCRETIEEHNALSDTLQAVLVEAGIVPG